MYDLTCWNFMAVILGSELGGKLGWQRWPEARLISPAHARGICMYLDVDQYWGAQNG